MRWPSLLLGAIAVALMLPAGAGAAVGSGTLDTVTMPAPAQSATHGPDGSTWVTLPTKQTVARVAPDGTVTETADLGGALAGIAVVGGKIWAAVSGTKKIAVIDPATLATVMAFNTPSGSCPPVAIADAGGGQAYVSLVNGGRAQSCPLFAASAILPVITAGVTGTPVTGNGTAYDLLVASGSLWVPDYDSDVVRRLGLTSGLPLQSTYSTAQYSGPDGIAVGPDGQIVTTLFSSGGLARIDPAAPSSTAPVPFGGKIEQPFGLASVGTSLYVASKSGPPSIRRFPTDGSTVDPIPTPPGAAPWDVAPGPDGDVIVTDLDMPRLIRFTSRVPRTSTGATTFVGGTTAVVALTANPGGNTTSTSVELGTTTAYGSSANVGDQGGIKDLALSAALTGLQPATTYHYRAVASSPEGTTRGEDRTFTTGLAPPGTPRLAATIAVSSNIKRRVTRVTKIRVTGLVGGETIRVTCSGKGCPSKRKDKTFTVTAKKAGSLTVSASKITKAKLGKGAKVTVQVTKDGTVGRLTTVTASKTKKPAIVALCLPPGAAKPATC